MNKLCASFLDNEFKNNTNCSAVYHHTVDSYYITIA